MLRTLQLLTLLLAASLPSCGGGGGGTGGVVIFQITAITPLDQSEDIALTAEIVVFFSRPVDPASVDQDSVRVVAESGDVIPGTLTVPLLNNQLVRFVPLGSYFPFAVHRVAVNTDVRDTAGAKLDQDYTFEFQTQEQGPVLPTQAQLEDLGDTLLTGRWFHRMTLLSSNRFLVAGGYTIGGSVTDTAENLDPAQKASFLIPDRMQQQRAAHVQVRLDDGRVLLAGGETNDNPFTPVAGCEILDRFTFTFQLVAPMSFARSFAHGVLLPDGRVLVTGGQGFDAQNNFIFRDDAEIYDPVADSWTLLASTMAIGRSGHFSAVAPDGNVVVIGGRSGVASGEIFNVGAQTFGPAANEPSLPHFFGAGALMANGQPVVMGGLGSRGMSIYSVAFGFLNGINSMLRERAFATATAFADGRILVVGGSDFSSVPTLLLDTIDVFFPVGQTGKMLRAASLLLPRPTSHHAAGLGPNGKVWITGGLPTDFQDPALRQVVVISPE